MFRSVIKKRKQEYLVSKRFEKMNIAGEVLKELEKMEPPARFLERIEHLEEGGWRWREVGYRRALEKISQALRERGEYNDQSSMESSSLSPSSSSCSDSHGDSVTSPVVLPDTNMQAAVAAALSKYKSSKLGSPTDDATSSDLPAGVASTAQAPLGESSSTTEENIAIPQPYCMTLQSSTSETIAIAPPPPFQSTPSFVYEKYAATPIVPTEPPVVGLTSLSRECSAMSYAGSIATVPEETKDHSQGSGMSDLYNDDQFADADEPQNTSLDIFFYCVRNGYI
jgi:hypothetical protein